MAKSKDIIQIESIVSLYQTSLNNVKGRTNKIIQKRAKDMCIDSLENIHFIAEMEIDRIGELVEKSPTKRRVPSRKAQLNLLGDAMKASKPVHIKKVIAKKKITKKGKKK